LTTAISCDMLECENDWTILLIRNKFRKVFAVY